MGSVSLPRLEERLNPGFLEPAHVLQVGDRLGGPEGPGPLCSLCPRQPLTVTGTCC